MWIFGGLTEWSAALSDGTIVTPSSINSGRESGIFATQRDPAGHPRHRDFLGHGACAGVVQHDLADAPRSQLGEDRVETLAAVAEGFGVGPVTERDNAVLHAGEVGTRALERLVQVLRVVGHVALAVRGRANQEQAADGKYARIEAVHHHGAHAYFAIVEPELELLRDQLGGAGHRPHEDG